MSEKDAQGVVTPPVELAAGGLIWCGEKHHRCLCVVHRVEYDDWVLPKGKFEPEKDVTLEATAVREAREETGDDASPDGLAGSYSYIKEGRPKVVLMWHMVRGARMDPDPRNRDEIDNVRWLPPDEAVRTLAYTTEREFVEHHCTEAGARPARSASARGPRLCRFWSLLWGRRDRLNLNRLQAALCGGRERFEGIVGRPGSNPNAWWADCARRSLEAAEAAVKRRDPDSGWGALHDAERFMVFGMNGTELLARADSLSAETMTKLKGWRLKAANQLFAHIRESKCLENLSSPNDEQLILPRHLVVESLSILNAHDDNVYHRLSLAGVQLNCLVVWCALLIGAVLLGSYGFVQMGSVFDWRHLAAIAVAGALGGVTSAMFQLSRVGEAKIPDALMHGLITSGRPLVGAASALFIYAVMHSGLISLVEVSKVNLTAGLVLGFAAGFGERLVLGAVAKVGGGDKEGASAGGGPPNGGSPGGGPSSGGPPRGGSPNDRPSNGSRPDQNITTHTAPTREVPQAKREPVATLPPAGATSVAVPMPAQAKRPEANPQEKGPVADKL